jgi:hypothetical protein
MMQTFTVQLAYMQGYSCTVDVEANSIEEACEKAYDETDDCWRAYDDCGDTYVEAIGDKGEAWAKEGYGSALPVPLKHAEEVVRLRAFVEKAKPLLNDLASWSSDDGESYANRASAILTEFA